MDFRNLESRNKKILYQGTRQLILKYKQIQWLWEKPLAVSIALELVVFRQLCNALIVDISIMLNVKVSQIMWR